MAADRRGMISRCRPVENSQFHGRLSQPLRVAGSCFVKGIALPNVGVTQALHSPLACGFWKLQFGTLSWFASTTLTAVFVTNDAPGLRAAAVAIVSPATPRAADAFNAVLPSPNRS